MAFAPAALVWRSPNRLSKRTAERFPSAAWPIKAPRSIFDCQNRTANNCARNRARYRWQHLGVSPLSLALWCNGNTAPFGGVILGSSPSGAATSLLFLRLDFGNLFPVLQFSFERLDKSVPKRVEDSRENVGLRPLERSRKRHLRSKPVLRMIAHDLGQPAEDRFPDKLRRILHAFLIENHHVIEDRLDVTLI